MRWLLATALIARSAAADPAVDYQRAKLHALTAHNLARDRRCTEALALRPRIEELDAEVARVAYSEDPALVACANGLGFEPPSLAPLVIPPAPRTCSSRPYLEPSLLLITDGGQPTAFNRIAVGALLRSCVSPVQGRLGVSAYIGHIGEIGAGLEAELNEAVNDDLRLGVHVAYESAHDGSLASVDLRLHLQDAAWVQVGAFDWSTFGTTDSGLAVGFGFEGKPGAVLGGIELGAGAVVFMMLLAALSNEST